MKKLLTGAGFSLLAAGLLALVPATTGQAQEITPESSTSAARAPGRHGLVRSYQGNTLQVRGLDGSFRSYTLTPEMAASLNLTSGELVSFDSDDSGQITRLQPPVVESVLEGTVSSIEGELVTVTSPSGRSVTTPVPYATISRLDIAPGKELMVIQYEGTWATKICCPPVAAVPPPPIGGGELPPEVPIQGLW